MPPKSPSVSERVGRLRAQVENIRCREFGGVVPEGLQRVFSIYIAIGEEKAADDATGFANLEALIDESVRNYHKVQASK